MMGNYSETKTPRLEEAAAAWAGATPDARIEAVQVLRGVRQDDDATLVVRWPEAAKRLGVTVRSVRYAVAAAGIQPVRLPGRGRSIGLRAQDLRALAGVERDGFGEWI